MGATPPKEVQAFMAAHDVDHDEVWQVHGASWVVKHKALERIANKMGIMFDLPEMIEGKGGDKIVAMCVRGFIPNADPPRSTWSIGEASPANNKNAYPYAMAEKRAKDRVILKLLDAHGSLYSEDEMDGAQPPGEPARLRALPKKDAKDIYTKMQREIDECMSRDALKAWGEANKDRVRILPDDWQDILRLRFEEKNADLRQKEAA